MKFKLVILSFFAVTCIIVNAADAYIDPNTGGIFFQSVLPFVYGILVSLVIFWKRIVGFFKGLFGSKKDADVSSEDPKK